mgnify:CR=1 FL=1
MATNSTNVPQYGTTMRGNTQYYRTRILDADGKQVALYATTPEELYKKERKARREVAEIIFRNNNPTVEDYCKKWLLMKSATISASTLKNYTNAVNKYISAKMFDHKIGYYSYSTAMSWIYTAVIALMLVLVFLLFKFFSGKERK